jgi:DNA-binding IclR family transcriptional regulator
LAETGERVLDILEYFRSEGRPARASRISSALELPNSSVDRLLKAMVYRGYLEFDVVTKLYAPTYRIVNTAHDFERNFFGGRKLRVLVESLRNETGRTVIVSTQNDCLVQCVAVLPGENFDQRLHYEGNCASLFTCAPGTALMASRSDREIVDIAKRASKQNLFAQARLGEAIKSVHDTRRRGYSIRRGNLATTIRLEQSCQPVSIGFCGHSAASSKQDGELGSILLKVLSDHSAASIFS